MKTINHLVSFHTGEAEVGYYGFGTRLGYIGRPCLKKEKGRRKEDRKGEEEEENLVED